MQVKNVAVFIYQFFLANCVMCCACSARKTNKKNKLQLSITKTILLRRVSELLKPESNGDVILSTDSAVNRWTKTFCKLLQWRKFYLCKEITDAKYSGNVILWTATAPCWQWKLSKKMQSISFLYPPFLPCDIPHVNSVCFGNSVHSSIRFITLVHCVKMTATVITELRDC